MKQQAVIIGATGLVGSHLLNQLLADERFNGVRVLTRRPTQVAHPKLTEHTIDFNDTGSWASLVKGDVLYLCLGTTRTKAGGKKPQYKVDYTYQYRVAEAASANNVPAVVLVSSAGADAQSRLFYLRMKGELEEDLRQLPFERRIFIRPGALTGIRHEKRILEHAGVAVLRLLNCVGVMRKLSPIHADTVARAMVKAALVASPETSIYEGEEVFALANQ
ncbi:MAG: NAD(P)H-binding protein [Bacteroidales bacterium]